VEAISERRGWETRQAQAAVRALAREGLAVIEHPGGETTIRLSESGRREAEAVVRRHRLWEHYLIRHARFDSGHVDRGADELEHLLPVDLLEQLEAELSAEGSASGLPSSPHRLEDRPGGEAPIA
ncbi:MAG: iron dependent repressor, metal binding and dimerization domain protein, partial [Planctomycetota bacterium]|nr:iron dependent repressor, metal binding and dimerization domain protein [Planctomycetota bacterium]